MSIANVDVNRQDAPATDLGGSGGGKNEIPGGTHPDPPPVTPTKGQATDWVPGLHEIVTAFLGIIILAVTMTMMYGAYQTAAATYPDSKPITAPSP